MRLAPRAEVRMAFDHVGLLFHLTIPACAQQGTEYNGRAVGSRETELFHQEQTIKDGQTDLALGPSR